MSSVYGDRITAIVIMLVATVWCWAVIETVPAGDDGTPVGARGFPLGMGILLFVLGFILLVGTRWKFVEDEGAPLDGSLVPAQPWSELAGIAAVLFMVAAYVFLLDKLGFIVGTFLTVVLGLGGVLRIWRPRIILGLSIGLAVGIYILFGKVLGVYLPHGSWFDLTF